MISFAAVGNDLYTGKRSIDFVGRRKTWYIISGVLIAAALLGVLVQGLNLSLEFRGGSEFRVSQATNTSDYESRAADAVASVETETDANVTQLGSGTVRVQTERLDDAQAADVQTALAQEFGVDAASQVSSSFVGPSWGASVSRQAIQALIVFLVLVSIVMAIYFRTWKMALAALVALLHDLVVTVGIYALSGFEVSPATMIGFLTILGYSLYDTVVVFDKVRENTTEALGSARMNYPQAANLAVNQTLVRSINTTIVSLLPIGSIMVVGFLFLGPGTLLDLALALFVGISVGAYSSIFIATPLLVWLRRNEPQMIELAKRAQRYQDKLKREHPEAVSRAGGDVAAVVAAEGGLVTTPARNSGEGEFEDGAGLTGRKIHPYAQTGPRGQPKRPPKSRR